MVRSGSVNWIDTDKKNPCKWLGKKKRIFRKEKKTDWCCSSSCMRQEGEGGICLGGAVRILQKVPWFGRLLLCLHRGKRLLEEERTFRVIGLVVCSLRERETSFFPSKRTVEAGNKKRNENVLFLFFYMTRMCGEFVVDHSRGKDSWLFCCAIPMRQRMELRTVARLRLETELHDWSFRLFSCKESRKVLFLFLFFSK